MHTMKDEMVKDSDARVAQRRVRRGRVVSGVTLILLGALIIAHNLYPGIRFRDYWPLILIGIGLVLIVRSRN